MTVSEGFTATRPLDLKSRLVKSTIAL
jgi:hypothetical protein